MTTATRKPAKLSAETETIIESLEANHPALDAWLLTARNYFRAASNVRPDQPNKLARTTLAGCLERAWESDCGEAKNPIAAAMMEAAGKRVKWSQVAEWLLERA